MEEANKHVETRLSAAEHEVLATYAAHARMTRILGDADAPPTMSDLLLASLAAGLLAAILIVVRNATARRWERRSLVRRPVGPDGIIVGASPILLEGRREAGLLLLHGFGDTPQTLTYLAAHLCAAGYTVRVPLLSGHGRTLPEFAASSGRDWLEGARTELDALTKRFPSVAVVGLSLGGALATMIVAGRRDVRAIVLVSPYLDAPKAIRRLSAVHRIWSALMPYLTSHGVRSIHDPAEREKALSFGIVTPTLLRELTRVVERARASLPLLTQPVLMVQSTDDNRITRARASDAFRLIGARDKTLEWVSGSGHVLTVDYGKERVFARIAEWLTTHIDSLTPVGR